MGINMWDFPDTVGGLDVTGFGVEAVDGSIGKVKEFTNDAGASFLVVDTGVWIFGKSVILPAGLVQRVDRDEEKLYLAATKDTIKDAPEFDEDAAADWHSAVGEHYRRAPVPTTEGARE